MEELNTIALLLKTLHFAANKHRDQRRKDIDASPYINHPIEVAEVLARVGGVTDLVTLQGAILHDTIEDTKTTPEELVRAMVNRFNEVFTPEWGTRANQMSLTVHQVVTLASIIEKEAKIPDERPHMASVFLNRLRIGMPLGSDPTFIYAAILAGDYDGNPNQPRFRQRQSPYNTYLVTGLPPGPIASPGRASIDAV